MNLIDQVVSLELSKRLKELGVWQHSLFYWVRPINEWQLTIVNTDKDKIYFNNSIMDIFPLEHCAAFTVAELGKFLPKSITVSVKYPDVWGSSQIEAGLSYDENGFPLYSYQEDSDYAPNYLGEHEADYRAEMLIWLLQEKLMELPK